MENPNDEININIIPLTILFKTTLLNLLDINLFVDFTHNKSVSNK